MADYGNRTDHSYGGNASLSPDERREIILERELDALLGENWLLDDDLEFDAYAVSALVRILWDWRTGEHVYFARFEGGAMLPISVKEFLQVIWTVRQKDSYPDIDGAEGTGIYEGCKVDVFLLDERYKARLATKRYGFLSSKPMPKVWAFLEKVEATA